MLYSLFHLFDGDQRIGGRKRDSAWEETLDHLQAVGTVPHTTRQKSSKT